MRCALTVLLAVALAGCGFGRYVISDPERNRVLRVESGDRFYFDLVADASREWSVVSDDPDAEVDLTRATDGMVSARLRIHRGYDGPSVLTFSCREISSGNVVKTFTMTLYRHTGDSAFWE